MCVFLSNVKGLLRYNKLELKDLVVKDTAKTPARPPTASFKAVPYTAKVPVAKSGTNAKQVVSKQNIRPLTVSKTNTAKVPARQNNTTVAKQVVSKTPVAYPSKAYPSKARSNAAAPAKKK